MSGRECAVIRWILEHARTRSVAENDFSSMLWDAHIFDLQSSKISHGCSSGRITSCPTKNVLRNCSAAGQREDSPVLDVMCKTYLVNMTVPFGRIHPGTKEYRRKHLDRRGSTQKVPLYPFAFQGIWPSAASLHVCATTLFNNPAALM